jgi:hypothetical protein
VTCPETGGHEKARRTRSQIRADRVPNASRPEQNRIQGSRHHRFRGQLRGQLVRHPRSRGVAATLSDSPRVRMGLYGGGSYRAASTVPSRG